MNHASCWRNSHTLCVYACVHLCFHRSSTTFVLLLCSKPSKPSLSASTLSSILHQTITITSTTCKTHHRQSYFEALDLAINAVQDRFDQPHFSIYHRLEELLLKTVRGESTQEEYEFLCQFYNGDFDNQQLQLQLEILPAIFPEDLKSATLCINNLKQFVLSDQKMSVFSLEKLSLFSS